MPPIARPITYEKGHTRYFVLLPVVWGITVPCYDGLRVTTEYRESHQIDEHDYAHSDCRSPPSLIHFIAPTFTLTGWQPARDDNIVRGVVGMLSLAPTPECNPIALLQRNVSVLPSPDATNIDRNAVSVLVRFGAVRRR